MFEVAIGLGVIISLFFLETFGAAAGGIVVSGYIALYLHHPWTVVATLIISFVVWFFVKVLRKWMFMYGRRRMVFSILAGFILGWLVRHYGLLNYLPGQHPANVIGFIIPGLIANSMERQGIIPTLAIMGVAAVIVRFILILVFNGQLINF